MQQYKVLKPCVVPQKDGSARSYRRYGEIIDVEEPSDSGERDLIADADRLVADGFLEKVRRPEDEPKSKGGNEDGKSDPEQGGESTVATNSGDAAGVAGDKPDAKLGNTASDKPAGSPSDKVKGGKPEVKTTATTGLVPPTSPA